MRTRSWAWRLGLAALAGGCNAISGAGELEIAPVDDTTTTASDDAGTTPSRSDAHTDPSSNPDDSGGAVPEAGEKEGGGKVVTPACTAALAQAKYDFEGSDQGWTHVASDGVTGSWPFDPWSRGAAAQIPCPSGECFGAERDKNYVQCQRGELLSPKINLSACSGEDVVLSFTHAYAFWTGSYSSELWFDGGIVELSSDDGATWAVPAAAYPGTVKINPNRGTVYKCVLPNDFHVHGKTGYVGNQNTPVTVEISVPRAAVTDKMRVRFSQASGVSSSTSSSEDSRSSTAAGWRIDDVRFVVK